MTAGTDGRIPLTIVTGFLGSGKTTIIRHVLGDPRFTNAEIIVNELGEIGIDHHLFRQTDERITLLGAGCACCARRDDLVEALGDLLRRYDRGELPSLDRVLLETTGLADPAPILHTIVADPLLGRRFRVDRVVTTLDAVAGVRNLSTYVEAMRQVATADVVILTKVDLAPDGTGALAGLVASINPTATTVSASHGRFDVEKALSDDTTVLSRSPASEIYTALPPVLHAPGGVASLSLEFDEPLDGRMLGIWLTMLLHAHGECVLRVKGLLDVGEEGPLLLEGVQHVVHTPRHLARWPDGERRGRLVFIVRDLDPDLIRESLAAFQSLASS